MNHGSSRPHNLASANVRRGGLQSLLVVCGMVRREVMYELWETR